MFRAFSIALILTILLPGLASAQFDEKPVKVFGYFQVSFQQYDSSQFFSNSNSFALQQLDICLQRDLDPNLRAFVNLEFINNYSSSHHWGGFEVSEAWLSYRYSRAINLKAGLLLPRFNFMNDIKNKTALLPYMIRPIAYESSFNEIIRLEEYVPQRAYIELYGNQRVGSGTVNYSAYVGNSPNINADPFYGQTGIDTTDTFLIGGRLGFDFELISGGFSTTYDRTNRVAEAVQVFDIKPQPLREIPRMRLGADLRVQAGPFALESEWIDVNYDEDYDYENLEFDFDLQFYYYTLFIEPTYGLKLYNGYWYSKEKAIDIAGPDAQFATPILGDFALELRIPTAGLAYSIRDKVTLKAQYARVREKVELVTDSGTLKLDDEFNYIALGFSAFL